MLELYLKLGHDLLVLHALQFTKFIKSTLCIAGATDKHEGENLNLEGDKDNKETGQRTVADSCG
jgi:hypothetical protein